MNQAEPPQTQTVCVHHVTSSRKERANQVINQHSEKGGRSASDVDSASRWEEISFRERERRNCVLLIDPSGGSTEQYTEYMAKRAVFEDELKSHATAEATRAWLDKARKHIFDSEYMDLDSATYDSLKNLTADQLYARCSAADFASGVTTNKEAASSLADLVQTLYKKRSAAAADDSPRESKRTKGISSLRTRPWSTCAQLFCSLFLSVVLSLSRSQRLPAASKTALASAGAA
jgi:hypothetical protein